MWRPICPSPATSSQGFFGRAPGQRRPGAESGSCRRAVPEGRRTGSMHEALDGRRVLRAAPRAHDDDARGTIRWRAGSVDDASPERRVAGAGRGGCRPGNGPEGRAPLVPCSDIMFIIGHFRSSLESPDRGRGARRDRPGTTDAGTRLTRRPAPGCGTATRFTALSWLCGRAGEPSVQFSTATDRPDRTGRGWAG